MTSFVIQGEQFLLDGQPFKILSGAIHYFRVPRSDWYHSLYNLKALGFNTVETYVPWNLHEPQPGKFNFNDNLDVEAFIKEAENLGLYVIIRPSPYICAEWEFGGLPAWLLNENLQIRSSDIKFMEKVARYYDVLLPKLKSHLFTNGGPILMMQIENEYGSYGEDKDYLRANYDLYKTHGIDVPLFTSDGGWRATLRSGTLTDIPENILITANFGSKGRKNFNNLRDYQEEVNQVGPLMCMEFWDGWFNRWGSEIVIRETDELIAALRETLELGSINLYMFHGGTNFGFMNGCSARGNHDLPQISSYDYGAPLDEQGNPTEKYYAIQELIHEMFPELPQSEPIIKSTLPETSIPLVDKVSLFSVLDQLGECVESKYPQSMEALGHHYGYLLYQTSLPKDSDEERLRLIDARDRCQVYVNEEFVTTQYQEEIGEDITLHLSDLENQLDILVENMGRVNYGHKLLAETQTKGFRQGVMADLHFLLDWKQYLLDFSHLSELDFSRKWQNNQPSFYRYSLHLDEIADTFIDLSSFGKGIVSVNGYILGRFWDKGPIQSLYCPSAFLNQGNNDIIVFETEGVFNQEIQLLNTHKFKGVTEK